MYIYLRKGCAIVMLDTFVPSGRIYSNKCGVKFECLTQPR